MKPEVFGQVCYCDHIVLLHGLLKRGGTGARCQLCDCAAYKERTDHPAKAQTDRLWTKMEQTPELDDKILLIISLFKVVGPTMGVNEVDTDTISGFAAQFLELPQREIVPALLRLEARGFLEGAP